jgi:hypothetical protein
MANRSNKDEGRGQENFEKAIEKQDSKKSRLRALRLYRDIMEALRAKELNRAEYVLKSFDLKWVKSF